MKDKFLQFFTGKMSKSIYISIAAAVVCGAVVITSTVIVHNNNQKIDSVLESLAASESVSESVAENVTESVLDADNTELNAQAKAPNGEPAGDKALQYLAEYDKLTAEYNEKRAKILKDNQELLSILTTECIPPRKVVLDDSPESISRQAELDAEYESQKREWEEQEIQAKAIQSQITTLDTQYEKDVANLKAKYGIA